MSNVEFLEEMSRKLYEDLEDVIETGKEWYNSIYVVIGSEDYNMSEVYISIENKVLDIFYFDRKSLIKKSLLSISMSNNFDVIYKTVKSYLSNIDLSFMEV